MMALGIGCLLLTSILALSSAGNDAQRVNFTLYYESLCGGCRDFIRTQYYPAFKSIGSIMNVGLVPYGNAFEKRQGSKWVFTCQHGKEECIGNLIETCAINKYPNASDYFPFIHCIETSTSSPRQAAPTCADKFGMDYSSIESCVNGDLGNYLEHQMALKTQALNPPHQYVPWVTLQGVHTEKIENRAEFNLVALICKTYEGNPKPKACQETQEHIKPRKYPKSKKNKRRFNENAVSAEHCDLPPSVWCSSREVARKCNVEKQCELFMTPKPKTEAPLVEFTLYMESLCPDCKNFIIKQLYPTFKSVGNIMKLTLVPYGNAEERQVGSKWVFNCQHGRQECYGNVIETCAIHFYPNVSVHFPFIYCIETSKFYPRQSAPKCAETFQLDYSQIKTCADGELGNSLEHEMALKTDALRPPHTYVPWVTLNGVHTNKIQSEAENDLTHLICDTYQGTPKPAACPEAKKSTVVTNSINY